MNLSVFLFILAVMAANLLISFSNPLASRFVDWLYSVKKEMMIVAVQAIIIILSSVSLFLATQA